MIYMFLAMYKIEKKDKTELLQFAQIRQMNEELKSILMNLTEGIILIEDDNEKVALINQEFNRIFTIPDDSSFENIAEIIRKPVVKVYNDAGNNNDKRPEYNIS